MEGQAGSRPIRVRWAGTCGRCSSPVPTRSLAWWDHQARSLTCLGCIPDPRLPAPPSRAVAVPEADEPDASDAPVPSSVVPSASVDPTPAVPEVLPLGDQERGVAGASARAERARRSAKREARIRAEHPKIGGLILAISGDPTSTKVWDQGAVGEERVGARLDEARPQIEVLHDRRIPRSRANLDHLVVAPNGIWVIDTKRYLDQRVEPRAVGRRKARELHLFVGNRDRSNLVVSMHRQVAQVRDALAGAPYDAVPVRGALCFIGATVGLLARPFEIDGVLVTWPKHLIRPLLDVNGGADPGLAEGDRTRIARHLADRFRPA